MMKENEQKSSTSQEYEKIDNVNENIASNRADYLW
jgi:hypothetical protein